MQRCLACLWRGLHHPTGQAAQRCLAAVFSNHSTSGWGVHAMGTRPGSSLDNRYWQQLRLCNSDLSLNRSESPEQQLSYCRKPSQYSKQWQDLVSPLWAGVKTAVHGVVTVWVLHQRKSSRRSPQQVKWCALPFGIRKGWFFWISWNPDRTSALPAALRCRLSWTFRVHPEKTTTW